MLIETFELEVLVQWPQPIVTDDSGVYLTSNYRSVVSIFSVPGLYDVIYRAEDWSGNVATCSFRITLKSKWKVCVGRHMAISTQSSSARVEERDRERIPKRKAADNIDLNKMSHRYVSGVLQNDWNDPVDFRSLDRSQRRCYIWVSLSYKTVNTVVSSLYH